MKALPFVALSLIAPALCAQGTGLQVKNGVLDSYVEVAHSPTLVPPSGVTVEAWVTYDGSTLASGWRYPTVLRHNLDAGKEQLLLRVDANNNNQRTLRWFVRGTQQSANALWSFTPGALKQWTHIAGTYDGTTARLYVNGKLVSSATGGGMITSLSGKMTIGTGSLVAQSTNPGMEAWNGEIDEVRLWPYARTAAEIQQTMNLELRMMPGEVSTWNLNGDAKDSSGGNTGKLVNNPQFVKNTLNLTLVPFPSATIFGAASMGCGKQLGGIAMGARAKIGTTLGIYGLRAEPNSPGFLLLAGSQFSTALHVLGVDVWIDPTTLVLTIPSTANSIGTHRVGLPIPNDPLLSGLALDWQYLFVNPSCSPIGFAATGGLLTVTIK